MPYDNSDPLAKDELRRRVAETLHDVTDHKFTYLHADGQVGDFSSLLNAFEGLQTELTKLLKD